MGGDCPLSALGRFARRARGVLGILLGTRGTAHRARCPEHGPWTVASCVRHPACININWHRSLYCSGHGRMQHQPKPSVRSSYRQIKPSCAAVAAVETQNKRGGGAHQAAAHAGIGVCVTRRRSRTQMSGCQHRAHPSTLARAARIGVLPFLAVLTGAIDIVCDRHRVRSRTVCKCGRRCGSPGIQAQRSSSQGGLVPET